MFLASLDNSQANQIGESLRVALEAANAGCWEWDTTTNINQWSNNLHQLYGLENSVKPSYEAWRLSIHPSDRDVAEDCVRTALGKGIPFECQWRVNATDAERWLFARGRPIKNANGKVTSYIGIVIDISKQKRAEIEASLREQQLHAIIDSLPAMVAYFDARGRHIFSNDLFKEAFVITSSFPSGKQKWGQLQVDFSNLLVSHIEKLKKGQEFHFSSSMRFNDGELHDLKVTMLPDLDLGGSFRGIYVFPEDRTDQIRSEMELHRLRTELDSMVRKQIAGQTVAAVAHELNQPLNAASTFSEALRRMLINGHSSASIAEAANRIQIEIKRAGDVLRNLLTSLQEKKEPVNTSQIDANEFVIRVIELYKNANAECDDLILFTPCEEPVLIKMDRAAMEKVLLNLFYNACDSISVHAPMEGGQVHVQIVPLEKMVEISVSDNGAGIPPNMAGQLFQPLRSSKPQGIGMGLTICRRLVELHGGRIWLAKGEAGATFTFSLPLFK